MLASDREPAGAFEGASPLFETRQNLERPPTDGVEERAPERDLNRRNFAPVGRSFRA